MCHGVCVFTACVHSAGFAVADGMFDFSRFAANGASAVEVPPAVVPMHLRSVGAGVVSLIP